jgi:hypothetical protein
VSLDGAAALVLAAIVVAWFAFLVVLVVRLQGEVQALRRRVTWYEKTRK